MINRIGWGQGNENNSIDWGKGEENNSLGWGKSYPSSWSGETSI